ncbi:hypothetical protein BUALT_Bualt08G0033000 [Buddleja alternifolia]|uniref:GRF-type domain-containing protein n=1 Tax=Buddleja alternifolia TaxID=168488 RepID=A0AAV6X4Y3_9LAMI|nr:hypothetical protein BUALT_Bualt08G0033000 [Buddleja alternifolia]
MNNICYCRRLAVIRCSWTDANPGRRFYSCELHRNAGGCGFFVWLDPPMCERSRNVIPGLLGSTERLQVELQIARRREKRVWIAVVISWLIFVLLIWLGASERSEMGQGSGEMKELPM